MEPTRAIKVLMLDPSGSSVHVTHNLCNHLAAAGCEVEVFTAPYWLQAVESAQEILAYRVHACFYRSTQMRSYQTRGSLKGMFWRFVRLMQHVRAMATVCMVARDFDLVHTQILPVPAIDFLFLRAVSARTPVVCTVHELVPHGSKFRRFAGACFAATYRRASMLFAYTEYTRQRLMQLGVPAAKILKVPHGSLEHLVKHGEERDPAGADAVPVVLFVGNIRQDKGVDVLVEAARRLRKLVPRFKVQIAGTPGFDLSSIQSSIKKFGLENVVEFRLGYVPDREFAQTLCNADVVALPYRRIEQSGVAIAACTFGKAIVATDCGGVAELVKEAGNGILVPVDDPAELASALAVVLLSREKREEFERRSRVYACEVLGWDSIISKSMAGYRAVLGNGKDAEGEMVTQEL